MEIKLQGGWINDGRVVTDHADGKPVKSIIGGYRVLPALAVGQRIYILLDAYMVSDTGKRARALQLESIHNWHSHVSDNQIGDQNKQLNPLESKMTKFLAIITY